MESTSEPTAKAMHEVLEDLRGQLFAVIDSLDEADLNQSIPGLKNTIGILLRHVTGSERYWMSGVVGDGATKRNRPAEFEHDPLQKATLLADLRETQAQTAAVLSRLSADDLRTTVEVTGSRRTWRTTKASAAMHAIQHLAYHLGQVRLMAAMLRAQRSQPA